MQGKRHSLVTEDTELSDPENHSHCTPAKTGTKEMGRAKVSRILDVIKPHDSIASHGNDHTGEFAKCKVHASLRRGHSIKQLESTKAHP